MHLTNSILKIDESHVADRIEKYIKNLLNKLSAKGVLIGLSGGVDSAVLSTLAVHALGKDLVHVSYLYDRDSERESEHKASFVANWLGLELEVQNIEPVMRDRQIYTPLIMRVITLSCFMNRCLLNYYGLIFSESAFISTLRQGRFEANKLKQLVFNFTMRPIEAGFNARHIYRREVLQKQAKDQGLLLLGAANRSEYLVGWFVKGGIDDLPLSPLMGLYKTQIRQLTAYLGIPSEIQSQVPSPDMFKGITDEFAMGISYSKIDIILDGIDRGLPDKEMIAAGVTRKEISLVREMNRLSLWKRESEHADPPVDGRTSGRSNL